MALPSRRWGLLELAGHICRTGSDGETVDQAAATDPTATQLLCKFDGLDDHPQVPLTASEHLTACGPQDVKPVYFAASRCGELSPYTRRVRRRLGLAIAALSAIGITSAGAQVPTPFTRQANTESGRAVYEPGPTEMTVHDPTDKWVDVGRDILPFDYEQGVAFTGDGLVFSSRGSLYRTTFGCPAPEDPALPCYDVQANDFGIAADELAAGYNHVGAISAGLAGPAEGYVFAPLEKSASSTASVTPPTRDHLAAGGTQRRTSRRHHRGGVEPTRVPDRTPTRAWQRSRYRSRGRHRAPTQINRRRAISLNSRRHRTDDAHRCAFVSERAHMPTGSDEAKSK